METRRRQKVEAHTCTGEQCSSQDRKLKGTKAGGHLVDINNGEVSTKAVWMKGTVEGD